MQLTSASEAAAAQPTAVATANAKEQQGSRSSNGSPTAWPGAVPQRAKAPKRAEVFQRLQELAEAEVVFLRGLRSVSACATVCYCNRAEHGLPSLLFGVIVALGIINAEKNKS
jgi:hypothetical protein